MVPASFHLDVAGLSALQCWARIYHAEAAFAQMGDEHRRQCRWRLSKPLWDEFEVWLKRQRTRVADDIFEQQPNLLASILVLSNMGVSTLKLEVPLQVLLVAFQAMKRSGYVWRAITEDVQEQCLQRLTARMLFNEGPG